MPCRSNPCSWMPCIDVVSDYYSTLLYSTLLYSTLLYSTLLYFTLLYSTDPSLLHVKCSSYRNQISPSIFYPVLGPDLFLSLSLVLSFP